MVMAERVAASLAAMGGIVLLVACGAADPEEIFRVRIAEMAGELIDVRRDLHRHPELSGSEIRTAGIVADRLRALGLEVRTGVGGHGVVAILRGSRPGPVVAVRADMDAVPSDAPDPVAFPSETPGVRHICGHDVHTTVALALAEGLTAARTRLAGTVVFLFQPAEENATGARAMLEDGALVDPVPEAIFTVHAAPLPVGQLATAERVLMPGRDAIVVKAADGRNAVRVLQEARRVIEQVGTVPPEEAFAPVAGRFVLAQIGSPVLNGDARWSVQGMLTMSDDATRAEVKDHLLGALEALGSDSRPVEVTYHERVIAGVTNEPGLVRRAVASVRRVLGDESVVMLESMTPAFSEDFGSLQARVPGVMFFLGVASTADGFDGMPHSPAFAPDEGAIEVGARALGAVVIDVLTGRQF
jgi:amidohydrolase